MSKIMYGVASLTVLISVYSCNRERALGYEFVDPNNLIVSEIKNPVNDELIQKDSFDVRSVRYVKFRHKIRDELNGKDVDVSLLHPFTKFEINNCVQNYFSSMQAYGIKPWKDDLLIIQDACISKSYPAP